MGRHAGRARGAPRAGAGDIKTYVLVEQLEASYQLMEIRAALGAALRRLQHRPLGLHQQRGRRDGLGPGLRQSQHRRHHDDVRLHARVRGPRPPRRQHAGPQRPLRAVAGRHGAEHPRRIGGRRGQRHEARGRRRRSASSRRAPAASGWRTGRWSTSCARCGRRPASATSSTAATRRWATAPATRAALTTLEPAPRTVRGARDLLSVALQYGNAFGRGFQAAALKPATSSATTTSST